VPCRAAAAVLKRRENPMIRAAVIGLSEAGREHAQAYRADPLAELVGVCDGDPGRAVDPANPSAAPAFAGVADLLAAARPELCTIWTPLPGRAGDIHAALEASVHVLAALPLTDDPIASKELVALARRNQRVLAADFHLRFAPAVEKARAWLAAGEVGSPLFINLNLWTHGVERPGGTFDLFRNLGAHGADMMRLFGGDVARVQCFGTKAPGRASWSSLQVNMQFESGAVGTLTTSYDMVVCHPMARLEMAGTRARFVIENVYEEATLYVHAEEEKRVVTNSIFGGIPQLKETYARRIHRLLEQIAAGTAPEAIDGGAEDALAAARIMEAAIASLDNETVVDVRRTGASTGSSPSSEALVASSGGDQ